MMSLKIFSHVFYFCREGTELLINRRPEDLRWTEIQWVTCIFTPWNQAGNSFCGYFSQTDEIELRLEMEHPISIQGPIHCDGVLRSPSPSTRTQAPEKTSQVLEPSQDEIELRLEMENPISIQEPIHCDGVLRSPSPSSRTQAPERTCNRSRPWVASLNSSNRQSRWLIIYMTHVGLVRGCMTHFSEKPKHSTMYAMIQLPDVFY